MKDLTMDTDCGGYTNSFKYISGPAFDGSDPYNADLSQLFFKPLSRNKFALQGNLIDSLWVGTHELQI